MNYLQTLREEYAAANRWRLQGDVAQATAIRFLGISARIALLILLFLPFSAAKMPWLAAALIMAAAGTAWRCRQLASLGHYASALQRYGWVLLLLIVLPLLLFGRNLSYCALIVFTIVPTYVTVLGARAALLYVAAFLALAAAFFLAIPLGLDLPLLFPLHTPMQIATVLYAALAIVVPMLSVLSGVYQERARADRALRDRQVAEQSLQLLSDSLAQRLSQTETLLRSALEVIGEAFVIFDPQDRLVFCNEEYRKVYAKAAPMIAVGRSFAEILRCGADNGLFPDALGQVDAWVAERLAARQGGDTRLVQRLEGDRWMKVLEQKTASGYTVSFRVDISEQFRAKEAAESASRAKSEFLAIMSHEIRTPMNAVLGMAQVLLNPELAYQERTLAAQTILRSGQAMMEVLNDILDVAKIESGKLALRPLAFAPAELLQECTQLFVALALSRNLQLEFHSRVAEGSRYLADAGRIRQILSNLIGNAVKFTERGRIQIEVQEIACQGATALLEFSVTDSGAGIDAQHLPQMFQPFTQLDGSSTRKFGGTGLGLSIVSKVAELMGGSAGASSQPGQGSRFWFRIQAQVLESADLAAPVAPVVAGTRTPALRLRGHVLVVEDQPMQRKLLALHLDKLGLSHEAVENGALAVQAVQSGRPFDAILMDMNLPVIDGLQATRAIRLWERSQQWHEIPIVAITANAFDVDRSNCLASGMNAFLAKPIYFDLLYGALQGWLAPAAATGAGGTGLRDLSGADRAMLRERGATLLVLLQRHAFSALAALDEMKLLAAQTLLAPELEAVGQCLKEMDFPAAEQALQRLLQHYTEEACV